MDLIKEFPNINFIPGRYNMWSPNSKTVTYDVKRLKTQNGRLGLLHEISHALLGHRIYKLDMELINMEMDAWDLTRTLANRFEVKVDESHIARCIDTYDAWMSKRATCPDCTNFSLQRGRDEYGCFACGSIWSVNWRKDRRVKRTVTERYQNPLIAQTQPDSVLSQLRN